MGASPHCPGDWQGKLPVCHGKRQRVAVAVNGGGELDLILVNFGANTLTVLTNNGSGGFGSNATYAVGNGPWCVTAADINNAVGKASRLSQTLRSHALGALGPPFSG